MLKDTARYPVSFALKHDEYELYLSLKQQGIKPIEIFRRGIREVEKDLVKDLTQNNNS